MPHTRMYLWRESVYLNLVITIVIHYVYILYNNLTEKVFILLLCQSTYQMPKFLFHYKFEAPTSYKQ